MSCERQTWRRVACGGLYLQRTRLRCVEYDGERDRPPVDLRAVCFVRAIDVDDKDDVEVEGDDEGDDEDDDDGGVEDL